MNRNSARTQRLQERAAELGEPETAGEDRATVAPGALFPLAAVGSPHTGWVIDVCRVDRDGDVAIAAATKRWGWDSDTPLLLDVRSPLLGVERAFGESSGASHLDRRHRLRLPRTWRRLHRAEARVRVVVFTAPVDGPQAVWIELADRTAERLISEVHLCVLGRGGCDVHRADVLPGAGFDGATPETCWRCERRDDTVPRASAR